MVSKKKKALYRSDLFKHLDGIVTAPTAYSLKKKGVLDFLLRQNSITISTLAKEFDANEGYLNVALRTLAAQGWLNYAVDHKKNEVWISKNEKSKTAFAYCDWYELAVTYLNIEDKFSAESLKIKKFSLFQKSFESYKNGHYPLSKNPEERLIQEQILKHIEGVLVGPVTVFLAMNGFFHNYFMEASFRPDEFHRDADNFGKILDFFCYLDWFTKKNNTYTFTEKGFFYAKRASAYGVTVSYIPTLRKVENLLFGDFSKLRNHTAKAPEIHVDRVMNVWGSGGAHAAYFNKIDEIIISIFNRPLDRQPKGILDMGCGNGAFLIHLFDVIEKQTLRGKHLEDHPLFLVGADYNKEALKVTRANLINADIWAKVLWADIGNPKQLDTDIFTDYNIHLSELLNVRTFLDHNRIWDDSIKATKKISHSTGAFATKGKRLSNNLVEESLKQHIAQWKPFIKKYGLIIIELHTIAPELTAQHLGKTAATAYDTTHGFSDQYILELDVFLEVLKETGLRSHPDHFSKYPDNDLATVSIHYITEDTDAKN